MQNGDMLTFLIISQVQKTLNGKNHVYYAISTYLGICKINKRYLNVPRPEVIKEYNEKTGLDVLKHLISFNKIKVRSQKLPLKLTFHAVDVSVTTVTLFGM